MCVATEVTGACMTTSPRRRREVPLQPLRAWSERRDVLLLDHKLADRHSAPCGLTLRISGAIENGVRWMHVLATEIPSLKRLQEH